MSDLPWRSIGHEVAALFQLATVSVLWLALLRQRAQNRQTAARLERLIARLRNRDRPQAKTPEITEICEVVWLNERRR
jgi:uncharacterized coiled-coil protein SlyX